MLNVYIMTSQYIFGNVDGVPAIFDRNTGERIF
jgi:hypothetical protein